MFKVKWFAKLNKWSSAVDDCKTYQSLAVETFYFHNTLCSGHKRIQHQASM